MIGFSAPIGNTGTPLRDKISAMQQKISGGFAAVIIAAIVAIVALKIWGETDTADVMQIVTLLFQLFMYGELRSVKEQTNGTSTMQAERAAQNERAMQAELAMYRQHAQRVADNALAAAGVRPDASDGQRSAYPDGKAA